MIARGRSTGLRRIHDHGKRRARLVELRVNQHVCTTSREPVRVDDAERLLVDQDPRPPEQLASSSWPERPAEHRDGSQVLSAGTQHRKIGADCRNGSGPEIQRMIRIEAVGASSAERPEPRQLVIKSVPSAKARNSGPALCFAVSIRKPSQSVSAIQYM